MDRIRRIEIFLKAADAGSFARAAASLALTPSAVSRAIADLEEDLHVALFYRTTRQIRLTDEGEELYRRGHQISAGLADLQTAMRRTAGRVTGTLRVGVSVNVNRYIIMPGLARFLRQHSGLRVEFSVISQPREMHAEGLDVMLRVIDPPNSGLIARKMAELRFGVYASPKYLNTAGVPAGPEDLLGHRCFAHRPPQLAKPLDEWTFERSGERRVVKIVPAFSTTDREALIAAVVGGAGIMRIGMFDPALITSGRLCKLLSDWTCPGEQSVYAMYRRTPRLAAKITAFLAFVEEAFATFDPDELTIVHKSSRPKLARGGVHSRRR